MFVKRNVVYVEVISGVTLGLKPNSVQSGGPAPKTQSYHGIPFWVFDVLYVMQGSIEKPFLHIFCEKAFKNPNPTTQSPFWAAPPPNQAEIKPNSVQCLVRVKLGTK